MMPFAPLASELEDQQQNLIHRLFPVVPSGGISHIERLFATGRDGLGIRPTEVVHGEPLSHYLARTGLHSRASAHAPSKEAAQDAGRWWDFAWKYWKEELKAPRPEGVHAYGWGLWLLLRDHQRAPLVTFDESAPYAMADSWKKRLDRLDKHLAVQFPTAQARWDARWRMLQAEAVRPDGEYHAPYLKDWSNVSRARARERHLSAGLLQTLAQACDHPDDREVLLAPDATGRRRIWTLWEAVVQGIHDPAWQGWPDDPERVSAQKTPSVYAGSHRTPWINWTPDPVLDRGAANLLAETLPRGVKAVFGTPEMAKGLAHLVRWPWDPVRAEHTLAVIRTLPDQEQLSAQLRRVLLAQRPAAPTTRPRYRA